MLGLLNVLGLLKGLGLLSVLGLLVPELPRPAGLPRLDGLVDSIEPRWRTGPLRPDELRRDVALDDTLGFTGLVGVRVEFRELPTDDAPVESDEADEPAGDVGAQLTPGVIAGDGLVVLVVDLVELELVPVVPVVPVPGVPVPGVVCANAGAVLKAIAHTSPAPLRIGIFRILVKMFLLPMRSHAPALDLPFHE